MNDEACPYYSDIINNFMIGFKFLKEEFDVYPSVGWQIDPFGHSAAHAYI